MELPVSAKFPAILSSNGKLLGSKKTVIYIVEDISGHSIMCDMIIGRPTIAESDYHCIDTRDGTLFNKRFPRQAGPVFTRLPGQNKTWWSYST